MAKKNKQVRIRIKPLHGIGGVGTAGDTTWMDEKEAKQYEKEGYLEILPDADDVVPSSKGTSVDAQLTLEDAGADDRTGEDEPGENSESQPGENEDHTIIAPESKRQ